MDPNADQREDAVYIVPRQDGWGVELVYDRTLYTNTSTPDRNFALLLAQEAAQAFGELTPSTYGLKIVDLMPA
jgi:hypothetical protein